MTPRKLDLLIATFPYGGNGGFASEHPAVRNWLLGVMKSVSADPRIGRVRVQDFNDTPIPMTRNKAVQEALGDNYDLVLMVDSDQAPDVELGADPHARPFWDSSFEFLYDRYEKGPHVVASPYCGPPVVQENVYAFYWANEFTGSPDSDFHLEQYTRAHAADMLGIQPAGAAATGVILYDTRAFALVKPPFFYYEFNGDGPRCEACGCRKAGQQAEKASTEDVTATRDVSLAGIMSLGYNPLHINWDAWAGHWKPKCVRKPRIMTADGVAEKMLDVVRAGRDAAVKRVFLHENMPRKFSPVPVAKPETMPPSLDNGRSAPRVAQSAAPAAVVDASLRTPDEDELRPHPQHEKFRRIDGHFMSERDCNTLTGLVQGLAEENPDRRLEMVEIGTHTGDSACAIWAGATRSGSYTTSTLWCIDTFLGSPDEQPWPNEESVRQALDFNIRLRSRCFEDTPPFFRIVRSWSQDEAKHWGTMLDLVFLDGNHSYQSVRADCLAWQKHVRPGGILCGHDYGAERFPGVKQAVDELYGQSVNAYGAIWWVFITAQSTDVPAAVLRWMDTLDRKGKDAPAVQGASHGE